MSTTKVNRLAKGVGRPVKDARRPAKAYRTMPITQPMEYNFVRLRELLELRRGMSLVSLRSDRWNRLAYNQPARVITARKKGIDQVLYHLGSSELYDVLVRTPRDIGRMTDIEEVRALHAALERVGTVYMQALKAAYWRDEFNWLGKFDGEAAHYYRYGDSPRKTSLLMRIETWFRWRIEACPRRIAQLETRNGREALQGALKDLVPLESVLTEVGSGMPGNFPLVQLPVCSASGTPYAYRNPLEITFETKINQVRTWGQLTRYTQAYKAFNKTSIGGLLGAAFQESGRRVPALFVPRTELAKRVVAYVSKSSAKGTATPVSRRPG